MRKHIVNAVKREGVRRDSTGHLGWTKYVHTRKMDTGHEPTWNHVTLERCLFIQLPACLCVNSDVASRVQLWAGCQQSHYLWQRRDSLRCMARCLEGCHRLFRCEALSKRCHLPDQRRGQDASVCILSETPLRCGNVRGQPAGTAALARSAGWVEMRLAWHEGKGHSHQYCDRVGFLHQGARDRASCNCTTVGACPLVRVEPVGRTA